jgi:DNA-binding response OmpR family regulator
MPMTQQAKVLVATDSVTDAELVKRMLQGEADSVMLSTVEANAVQEFERVRPDVLVLAFDAIEKAERYYLGLFRRSTLIHQHPHRTLVLCNKDELKRVFELCKKGHFDDYILFWPMTHDTPRLAMGVHHAWRDLRSRHDQGSAASALAAQIRGMDGLDTFLEGNLANGGEQLALTRRSIDRVGQAMNATLDGLTQRLLSGELSQAAELKDAAVWRRELARLRAEVFEAPLQAATRAVEPVQQWLQRFQEGSTPLVQSARQLRALVDSMPPVVLIVEDDPLQQKVLAKVMEAEGCELIFAGTGCEGLAALRRVRPDLVLMDVMLPDMDGVEATKRLKSAQEFQSVPVIMITGQSEKAVVMSSLQAGAADFVVKPFDRETLLAKVRHLLRRPAEGRSTQGDSAMAS